MLEKDEFLARINQAILDIHEYDQYHPGSHVGVIFEHVWRLGLLLEVDGFYSPVPDVVQRLAINALRPGLSLDDAWTHYHTNFTKQGPKVWTFG